MSNAQTYVVLLLVAVFSYLIKQAWVTVIALLMLVLILTLGKEEKKPKGSTGPLVQPIIVKRKYVGPESIYPEKMKIYYNPKGGEDWKDKIEIFGKFVGTGIRSIKKLFE